MVMEKCFCNWCVLDRYKVCFQGYGLTRNMVDVRLYIPECNLKMEEHFCYRYFSWSWGSPASLVENIWKRLWLSCMIDITLTMTTGSWLIVSLFAATQVIAHFQWMLMYPVEWLLACQIHIMRLHISGRNSKKVSCHLTFNNVRHTGTMLLYCLTTFVISLDLVVSGQKRF